MDEEWRKWQTVEERLADVTAERDRLRAVVDALRVLWHDVMQVDMEGTLAGFPVAHYQAVDEALERLDVSGSIGGHAEETCVDTACQQHGSFPFKEDASEAMGGSGSGFGEAAQAAVREMADLGKTVLVERDGTVVEVPARDLLHTDDDHDRSPAIDGMTPEQANDFYADERNQEPVGPPVRRRGKGGVDPTSPTYDPDQFGGEPWRLSEQPDEDKQAGLLPGPEVGSGQVLAVGSTADERGPDEGQGTGADAPAASRKVGPGVAGAVTFDPEAGAAYVTVRPHDHVARTASVHPHDSVMLDYDDDGRLLGVEVLGIASKDGTE